MRPEDDKKESRRAWEECTKNESHTLFKPGYKFTMLDLPLNVRSKQSFEKIRAAFHLTVRLRVNPVIADHMAQPPSLSEDARDKGGTGTGFVSNIVPCILNNTYSCDMMPEPSTGERKWWIDITTAAHVVGSTEEEVKLTMVDFFYDNDESRTNGRVKTLWCVELLEHNPVADWCRIRCVTDDDDLVTEVQKHFNMWNRFQIPLDFKIIPPLLPLVSAAVVLILPFLLFLLSRYGVPNIPNPHEWRNYVYVCTLGYLLFYQYQFVIPMKSWLTPLGFSVVLLFCIALNLLSFCFIWSRYDIFVLPGTFGLPVLVSTELLFFFFFLFCLFPFDKLKCCLTNLFLYLLCLLSPYICSTVLLTDTVLPTMFDIIEMVFVMITSGLPTVLILPNLNKESIQGSVAFCAMPISLAFTYLLQKENIKMSALLYLYFFLLCLIIICLLCTYKFKKYTERWLLVSFAFLYALSPIECYMEPFERGRVSALFHAVLLPPVLMAVRELILSLTVVIVSHPHGQPKCITVGEGSLSFYPSIQTGLSDLLFYRAETCKGSSGAMVIQLCQGELYKAKPIVHSMRRNKSWNASSHPVSRNRLLKWFYGMFQ